MGPCGQHSPRGCSSPRAPLDETRRKGWLGVLFYWRVGEKAEVLRHSETTQACLSFSAGICHLKACSPGPWPRGKACPCATTRGEGRPEAGRGPEESPGPGRGPGRRPVGAGAAPGGPTPTPPGFWARGSPPAPQPPEPTSTSPCRLACRKSEAMSHVYVCRLPMYP